MRKHKYFDKPTQVAYWDADGDHYAAGIAYCDAVICLCCGGIIPLEEIYEFAPTSVAYPLITFEDWEDLSVAMLNEQDIAKLYEINKEYNASTKADGADPQSAPESNE